MAGKHSKVLVNSHDIETLRALSNDHVVIITEKELIRGVDYKSKSGDGLRLLVTASSPSKRSCK